MKIKKWKIWLADHNPQRGTEPGKTRPVVIVQTDLLNDIHPSTIICPLSTNIQKESDILRVHLKRKEGGLNRESDILVDQLRAIDKKRLIKKLGTLPPAKREKLKDNIGTVLD